MSLVNLQFDPSCIFPPASFQLIQWEMNTLEVEANVCIVWFSFNLLSLGQLLTELCMPAFLTGKSQTEHSLECSAGS